MEALLASYRSPLFVAFPLASMAVSMGAFVLFAVPMTVVAALDPPALRRFRIQSRRPRPQELVGPSVRSWLVNNALLSALVVASWPVLRFSGIHVGPLPSWWVVVGQVLAFTYLDDVLYYWMHRTLHAPALYKRIHGWHHRIVTPWAITGHYMHPLEYVLTGSLALVGPLVVGAHVVTLWIWLALRQWEAAEGHSGYDVPWSPSHLLPFSDGATHHDFHHAKVRGNYAGYLPLWDGVFGTFARDYAVGLAARHPRGWFPGLPASR